MTSAFPSAALLLLAPLGRLDPQESAPVRPDDLAEALRVMESAATECNWTAVLEQGEPLLLRAERGSEPWFEVCELLCRVHRLKWRPDALRSVARAALDVVSGLRRAKPDVERSALGPLRALGRNADAARLLEALRRDSMLADTRERATRDLAELQKRSAGR